MNNEFEILVKLKKLKDLLDKKNETKQLLGNLDKLVDEKYDLKKPLPPKTPKKPDVPQKPFESYPTAPKKYIFETLGRQVLMFSFLAILTLSSFALLGFLGILMLLVDGILICGQYITTKSYATRLKKYEDLLRKNKKYEEDYVAYNEKVKMYNKELIVLRKKKEEYSKEFEIYKEEHDKNYCVEEKKIKENLKNLDELICRYNDDLSDKFHSDVARIIEIIEDGRADSLKEALNILISDKKQDELILAQKQYSEEKLAIERERSRQMEMYAAQQTYVLQKQAEQAKRQADAIEKQEDARRRGAPNCWECKNWPCGGDPAYCGSFARRD